MLAFVMAATRAFVPRVSGLLSLLAACATTPPPAPSSEPLPPPEAPAAPAALPERPPLPPASGEAASVDGAEGLTRLCEALRDEAAMTFPGNPVEQARAREAHALRRQTALNGRYVTTIPSPGFAFRSYDLGERRLVLDTERSLVLGDGAELFVPTVDPPPGFALGPELAERLLVQRSEGKVGLRLVFRPAGTQLRKDTCAWLGGGRVVKLQIEVAGAALLATDGSVLARADSGDYADASLAPPVRAPKVVVYKPRTAEGKDLPAALVAALAVLADRAQPCYERVLLVRPGLRGTVVLGLRIGAGGRVEAPRIEMSSLSDDAVTSCVANLAAKATIAGASSGQRLSVPLLFRSAEE
jgi:hypothetical protein